MALVPGQQHPGEGSPPFSWHAPTDAVNEEDVDRVWRQLLNVLNVGQPQAQAKSSLGQPQPPQHSTAADVTNGSPRSALTSSAHYADTGLFTQGNMHVNVARHQRDLFVTTL